VASGNLTSEPGHPVPVHDQDKHGQDKQDPPVPVSRHWWNPQRASGMRYGRYRPAQDRVAIPVVERSWPDQRLTAAPLWVPVDLRDGNQALAEPMDPERKFMLFSLLVELGFKEIEIGYPSASQADFDFARRLCLSSSVPEDVTIGAFTPARADLIARTFDAMRGARHGLIHLCAPTAPTWRSVVFGASRAEVLDMILRAADQVLHKADADQWSNFRFEFSPEVFNLTEPDYVLDVCNAVTERWDAGAGRPVIHNLPATVEVATPNIYADQIEYMHRNLARRDHVILSVHPHNDRGTGVAAAELAVLAGAQRVEGCLFGNGERTGNVDLVTLALNVFSQGIDPMIDLSSIDRVRDTVEYCTRMPVHPRHPYAGDLVYTAFSGTHQDAIRKGLMRLSADDATGRHWDVPYLPIDPRDVGRTYSAVIRVNSQSGKGGVAYLLESAHDIRIPRRVQVEFSAVVQAVSDDRGTELTGEELWRLFVGEYERDGVKITDIKQEHSGGNIRLQAGLHHMGVLTMCRGSGRDLGTAAAELLRGGGIEIEVASCDLQASRALNGPGYICFAEARSAGRVRWGIGLGHTPAETVLRAVFSSAVRCGAVADISPLTSGARG
jgi:2-isopropylmalate synthase